ncbi:AlbA family DNA-binding domain-containing protein [Pseudonocardia sichuanensis]
MPAISITNDRDGKGIYIDDIFWTKHKILERDQVRESRDEEIVADLLASMVLDSIPRYASDTLDEYYGLTETKERRRDRIEAALQREDPEVVRARFQFVHGEIETILNTSGKSFSQLVFKSPRQRVPRYYSTIFMVMYDLLIRKNRTIPDYGRLAKALEGIGDRVLKITGGGGTWSAENKRDNIAAVAGVLEEYTSPVDGSRDVLLEANESKVDRLLQAAVAEHSLFELKQGLHRLDEDASFDSRLFDRICETISALANDGPQAIGYVLIGVADEKKDADRVKKLHGVDLVRVRDFYVTGIDHELKHHGGSVDGYQTFLKERFTASDIDGDLRSQILRDLRPVRFHGRTVVLITVRATKSPVPYRDKWFERQGPSTSEIAAKDVGRLFTRFAPTG